MFSLSNHPLDPSAYQTQLQNPTAGALATFQGWVRKIIIKTAMSAHSNTKPTQPCAKKKQTESLIKPSVNSTSSTSTPSIA